MGLGLTARRLWGLTPREFDALKHRWDEHHNAQAHAIACLRADMHNLWIADRKGRPPYTAEDFLPAQKKRVQSIEEKVAILRQAGAMAGARKEHRRG